MKEYPYFKNLSWYILWSCSKSDIGVTTIFKIIMLSSFSQRPLLSISPESDTLLGVQNKKIKKI